MNRRVMAVTAAAVMSMSGFAVPAMADEKLFPFRLVLL